MFGLGRVGSCRGSYVVRDVLLSGPCGLTFNILKQQPCSLILEPDQYCFFSYVELLRVVKLKVFFWGF